MAERGHGSLVLVGSTAGLFGEAGHADYAAAKSAIAHGLLLSLKNEVVRIAPRARVNAVCPGWTESPMTRGSLDEETLRRVTRTMALEKVAQPEDVAAQVVVLASDVLSGHVTGQVVTVAGGMEGRVSALKMADGGPRGPAAESSEPQDDCRQSPAKESPLDRPSRPELEPVHTSGGPAARARLSLP